MFMHSVCLEREVASCLSRCARVRARVRTCGGPQQMSDLSRVRCCRTESDVLKLGQEQRRRRDFGGAGGSGGKVEPSNFRIGRWEKADAGEKASVFKENLTTYCLLLLMVNCTSFFFRAGHFILRFLS